MPPSTWIQTDYKIKQVLILCIFKRAPLLVPPILFQQMNDNQPDPPQQAEPHSPSSSSSEENKPEDRRERSSSSGSSSLSSEMELGEGENKDDRLVRYKYCCKICKHPDKSKKACVCVVPLSQRRADLGDGCRNCGCLGCSKEDFLSKGEDPEYHPQAKERPVGPIRTKAVQKRQKPRERSRSLKRKRSSPIRKEKSRSRSPQIIDAISMKFHNFDRSIIGNMIVNDFQVNPNLLGFAVPQRTYSYIFGRPR